MGGFYGSVQIRGRFDAVKIATESAARTRGIKCLVGPEIDGWIGVYPENNGQDHGVGEDIARAVKGEVIQLIVHDSDIFAYWFWRDGNLVDSYWSRPGYFGEEGREAQEAMSGNSEMFEPILGMKVERLQRILERNQTSPLFDGDRRLEQFAGLLGISNSMTAYEYLKSGERHGIKRWKEFIEAPEDAIRSEKSAAKVQKERIASEKKRMKAEGLLLCEESRKGSIPRACRAGAGFMVGWHGPNSKERELILWWLPPWKKKTPIEAIVKSSINVLASNLDGSLVAMGMDDRAIVWRSGQPKEHAEIKNVKWMHNASISADGRYLVHAGRDGIRVTEIMTGKRAAILKRESARAGLLHPNGKWLIAAHFGICSMEMTRGASEREFYVGGKSKWGEEFAAVLASDMESLNIDERIDMQRKSLEAHLAKAIASSGKGKKQKMTREQIDAFRASVDKTLDEYRKQLTEAKANSRMTPIQGNETPGCLCFSRDGTRLWCGTDKGLRGYMWEELLATKGNDMPAPRWHFEPEGVNGIACVYAIEEEHDGKAIVFAGYDGKVRRMELATDEVYEILTVPDGGPVIDLCLSANGSALSIISRPGMWEDFGGHNSGIWQAWAYAKLPRA